MTKNKMIMEFLVIIGQKRELKSIPMTLEGDTKEEILLGALKELNLHNAHIVGRQNPMALMSLKYESDPSDVIYDSRWEAMKVEGTKGDDYGGTFSGRYQD